MAHLGTDHKNWKKKKKRKIKSRVRLKALEGRNAFVRFGVNSSKHLPQDGWEGDLLYYKCVVDSCFR